MLLDSLLNLANFHSVASISPARPLINSELLLPGASIYSIPLLCTLYSLTKMSGFQPKGADRKQKTDREKMEKRTPHEKEKYQPSYETTILTEVRQYVSQGIHNTFLNKNLFKK